VNDICIRQIIFIMAISPTNKLVWLVKTIHKAGRITFKEIQMKWRDNEEMSGGVELPRRTFNNWIFAIWDMFGLDIRCEKTKRGTVLV